MSSDGNTALVGSDYWNVDGKRDAGAADVFRFTGGKWGSATELSLGKKAAASDAMGNSVALSADGNIALIGVPSRTVNGRRGAGAAQFRATRTP